MKRFVASLLALSLLLASAGPEATRAIAQVVPDVPSLGADIGGTGASGSSVGSIGSAAGALNAGTGSLNDPRFFVLMSLSTQLGGLTASRAGGAAAAAAGGAAAGRAAGAGTGPTTASIAPRAVVAGVQRLLTSPETLSNPSSPQAVAARTIYHALQAPGRVSALTATLESVHPALGGAVSAQLERTVRDFYASGGNPAMLKGLGEAVARLESLGPEQAQGVEGQLAMDKIFIGPLTSRADSGAAPAGPEAAEVGSDLRDAPAGLPVYIGGPTLALTLPAGAARLQPSRRDAAHAGAYKELLDDLPKTGEYSIEAKDLGAENIGGALRLLDEKAAQDANVSLLLRRLGDLNPDLGLDARKTFLFQRGREPELLRLLKVPEDAGGAARILTDGRRSLSILIVAVPSEGMTQTRLAEVLLHEGQHAADRGIFRIPTSEPLLHLLLEGYTQLRTQDRLVRTRAALGLKPEANFRYVDEVYLARSVIQAVGESPLKRLVEYGDESELREALGSRWTYLKILASEAAGRPAGENREEFFAALNQILHRPGYAPSDFDAALAKAFPDASAERRATASMEARGYAAEPRAGFLSRLHRGYAELIGRWSRPFRPDFDPTRAPASGKWGRAALTFLAFTALYNSLLLISAWGSHGLLMPFILPHLMPLGALPFNLALQMPVVAAGEEALFRVGLNGWLERKLTRLGASPQSAALYAAAASSVVFALAHIPAQGFDAVNLLLKVLFGLVAVHVYKKYGYGAAVANHYLWNASQSAAMALPFLTPLYVALPAFLALPALFQYKTRRK